MYDTGEHSVDACPKQSGDPHWIHYSAELIDELTADHSELMKMYNEIEDMAISGRYTTIPAALETFKTRFESHIFNENLRFYCYLEDRLAGSADALKRIKEYRTELNAIARDVVTFLRKYRSWGVRFTNGKAFLDELRCVGALLVHRVDREEKDLYPLYLP
jgi:hypothetical protein